MSTLSPDQHDHYLEVLDAAKSLFGGDRDAALHWLSCPLKAFGGKAPAAMATTRLETDTAIEFTYFLKSRPRAISSEDNRRGNTPADQIPASIFSVRILRNKRPSCWPTSTSARLELKKFTHDHVNLGV